MGSCAEDIRAAQEFDDRGSMAESCVSGVSGERADLRLFRGCRCDIVCWGL